VGLGSGVGVAASTSLNAVEEIGMMGVGS